MDEIIEGITYTQYVIYTGLIILVVYGIVPRVIDFFASLHDRMVYAYAC